MSIKGINSAFTPLYQFKMTWLNLAWLTIHDMQKKAKQIVRDQTAVQVLSWTIKHILILF